MSTTIYHGTPLTPNDGFDTVMPGRAACVSYYRPDQLTRALDLCPLVMLDNGAFSFWQQAIKAGIDPADVPDRDWRPFYEWLEPVLFQPGRWAVIPDRPGAPSQMSDALLNDNPFGTTRMAPVWHMDGPLSRLGRLCERYHRVCLGWVGETQADKDVGCDAYRRRMDEVCAFFGNRWPVIHMMRGVAVARDYPFRKRRQHQPGAKPSSLHARRAARIARRHGQAVGGAHRLRGQIGGAA